MYAPLDLQPLLVNVFAGNFYIFIVLMLAFIAAMAALFKLNNLSFFVVIVLFSALMGAYASWLLFLIIIIFGIAVYLAWAKLMQR